LFLKSDRPNDDLINKPKLVATSYNQLCVDCVVEEKIYRVSQGNVPNFRKAFLGLNYTDITKNTYIRS
jgi:hypothetical protein